MQRPILFSQQLRKVIDASDRSRYMICKELDFSESVMSRFMSGKCGLAMPTLDRLCELLELELVPRKRKGARK